jgi:hypothetical protein
MTHSSSDRIAICGEVFPTSLKQRLLFFDRIGVFTPWAAKQVLNTRWDIGVRWNIDLASIANDMEFLQEREIAFDAMPFVPKFEGGWGIAPREDLMEAFYAEVIEQKLTRRPSDENAEKRDTNDFIMLGWWRQLQARLCVRHLRGLDGSEASAVLSGPLLSLTTFPGPERQSTNIIEVVLDNLPMPNEQTPWEAILDFKADTEAQGYLHGLKVWMADIARQKLTPAEANEKLEWLLFQNKKHLEMHKLSYRWGTLGSTFVATVEILEDLVKLKWGKAAKAVVSIVDKRVDLMKAELSNPAKEVSYIVKAQEQFG